MLGQDGVRYRSHWCRMWAAIVAGSLVCLGVFVSAQSRAQTAAPASRQARDLIDAAGGLAVEYRADLQLQVIEAKGALLPAKLKIDVLEELFKDADSAGHPHKEKDVSRNNQALSKRMEWVYPLNLDALSIKTRVISAMLNVDAPRARELATQVRIQPPHSPCSSSFVYDVSGFYPVLLDVMRRGYTPDEITRSAQLAPLEKQIRDAQSPMQLVPLAHLLTTLQVDIDQLSRLSALYAEMMGGIVATDRELAYLEKYEGLNDAIKALAERNHTRPAIVAQLLESYRRFFVQSATAPACSDISTDRAQTADWFNQLVYEYSVGTTKLTSAALQAHGSAGAMQIQAIPSEKEITAGVASRLIAYRTSQDVPRLLRIRPPLRV